MAKIKPKKAKPVQKGWKRVVKLIFARFFKALFVLWLLTIVWVVACKFINPPITYLMIQRWVEDDYSINKKWVDIEDAPNFVPMSMLVAEDQKFLDHNGFDLEAIEKAWKKNQTGKKVRGGSTISQQTAKNVFLWPGRSWLRKGLETYFTVLIEFVWGKKRIMEVYINVVELGKGTYGVQAAANQFYGKDVKKLTKWQAAVLAAVLPSPTKYNAKSPGPYVNRRAAWVQNQVRHFPANYLEKTY